MVRKPKVRINYICIVLIVMLVAVLGVRGVFFFEQPDSVNYIVSAADVFIALVSAILIVLQLSDAKKIQEAEFIFNLNQSFVTNEAYANMYTKMENMRNIDKTASDGKKTVDNELTPVEISNYLTFFETIYLLLQEGVISMRVLNDLFAYRFFLAVQNTQVQEKKLVKAPENFRNIYYLEKEWMDYREKHEMKCYDAERSLKASCKKVGGKTEQMYDEIMRDFEKKEKKKLKRKVDTRK